MTLVARMFEPEWSLTPRVRKWSQPASRPVGGWQQVGHESSVFAHRALEIQVDKCVYKQAGQLTDEALKQPESTT